MALHPHAGPALAAFGLAHAPLEAVPGAFRISRGWLGLAEQLAQIEKMLLAGGALRQLHRLPLGDELLGRHGEEPRMGRAEQMRRSFLSAGAGIASGGVGDPRRTAPGASSPRRLL
jgi:hypothetical protein